jgi:drug/metabolite transporter (DMT)-like permease
MLLLATVGWALGFTWAKSAQETVNQELHLPPEAALGPVFILGVRYVLAGVLMLAVVARARRGWSRAGIGRAISLGGLLGAATGAQHLGLGRTSEAVSAFLTSLTVLLVPLLMTVALRRPPAPSFWIAAALATAGIWLMIGATPTGFGLGEALGLTCALLFSIHLITLNALVPRDDPWRMASGQFLVSGSIMLLICLLDDRGRHAMMPQVLWDLLQHREIWLNLLLSMIFPTFLSFILMTLYAPRLDPMRVALIYLMEPLFAAAYAYVARGRSPGWLGLTGAALILAANLLVELLNARRIAERSRDRAEAEPS